VYTAPNINQINIIFLPMILITAVGVEGLLSIKFHPKKLYTAAVVCYCVCFAAFCHNYFGEFKDTIKFQFFHSFPEAVETAINLDYDGTIYITREVNGAYVYTLLKDKTHPADFMETAKITRRDVMFQNIESFGRFVFIDLWNSQSQGVAMLAEGVRGVYVVPNHVARSFPQYLVEEFEFYAVLEVR
jgi:hypothetical protein